MKYVLLFVETEQFERDFEAMSQADRDRAVGLVYRWMADHADKIRGGSKLQPASSATTVRLDAGRDPVITDGPFVEGKEVVSGYTEVEVAGLLALIRLHRARADARFDPDGSLVLLERQERSNWDHETIADASRLLQRAARHRQPGPYQLQAAIVALLRGRLDWDDNAR